MTIRHLEIEMKKVKYFLLCSAYALCSMAFVEAASETTTNLKNKLLSKAKTFGEASLSIVKSGVSSTLSNLASHSLSGLTSVGSSATTYINAQTTAAKEKLDIARQEVEVAKLNLRNASNETKLQLAEKYLETTTNVLTKAQEYATITEADVVTAQNTVNTLKTELAATTDTTVLNLKQTELTVAETKLQLANSAHSNALTVVAAAQSEHNAAIQSKNTAQTTLATSQAAQTAVVAARGR